MARFSTSDAIDGTATSTRGRGNRVTPTWRITTWSMRWVMSNSVIVPPRRGRTATTLPLSPPISCHASSPMASTSPLPPWTATTQGWSNTMPSPWRYTRVFALPMSRARSRPTAGQLPWTQCASPLTRPSFFQMGTSCLSRSMTWRQASNASPRCAALTATTTLVSPTRNEPVRCSDGDGAQRPCVGCVGRELLQTSEGELVPRLVLEARDIACRRMIAHGPDEDACATRGGVNHERQRLIDGEGLRLDAREHAGLRGAMGACRTRRPS